MSTCCSLKKAYLSHHDSILCKQIPTNDCHIKQTYKSTKAYSQYYGPPESITKLALNEPATREIPQELSPWKPIALSMQHFEDPKYAEMAIA